MIGSENEVFEVVERLNEYVWSRSDDDANLIGTKINVAFGFEYYAGCYSSIYVTISGRNFSYRTELYNSENNDRDFIEEIDDYEDLYQYVVNIFNGSLVELQNVRLALFGEDDREE